MRYGNVICIGVYFTGGGAKNILGCSSKTCNEAVRGDMDLDPLKSRGDKDKFK